MGSVSYLLTPHQEGGLPEKGFRSSSTLCVSLTGPDKDHWSIYEDKKFVRLLQHLTNKHQKRQEKAEAEKGEDEGNEQEEEDAPTNTDLPGMEVNEDKEAPNPEEAPPRSDSTSKPLEHMLREMELWAKDGDLIFPISNVGRSPPYNHELPVEDQEKVEVAMSKICSIHLQAIYNAGGVRQVDQILAELLMAQFTRVNLMMGEDLNTSLQELFSVVEGLGKTLLTELKTALGPTVSNLVPYNLQRVVESHNSCLYMSLTKVLVFLNCARWEGCGFLEDRVKSLQSNEEFKKLITSLSKWISAFEDCVWELALSEELAEEEVALRVNLALTATRPMVGNYFSRVLEGLIGRLGIKIHEDENPPCSTQEGLEQCLTKEFQWSSPSSPSLEGCESRGLHVGYSLEYADSGKGPHVPALSSTAIPNLLEAIDCLQLGVHPPPKEGDPPKGQQGDPLKEHQDLLESLAVKDVPKPTDPKDIYQKFLNMLGGVAWYPGSRSCSGAGEPDSQTKCWGPTCSPWASKSTPAPGQGDPPANPGVPTGSDWEPGRSP